MCLDDLGRSKHIRATDNLFAILQFLQSTNEEAAEEDLAAGTSWRKMYITVPPVSIIDIMLHEEDEEIGRDKLTIPNNAEILYGSANNEIACRVVCASGITLGQLVDAVDYNLVRKTKRAHYLRHSVRWALSPPPPDETRAATTYVLPSIEAGNVNSEFVGKGCSTRDEYDRPHSPAANIDLSSIATVETSAQTRTEEWIGAQALLASEAIEGKDIEGEEAAMSNPEPASVQTAVSDFEPAFALLPESASDSDSSSESSSISSSRSKSQATSHMDYRCGSERCSVWSITEDMTKHYKTREQHDWRRVSRHSRRGPYYFDCRDSRGSFGRQDIYEDRDWDLDSFDPDARSIKQLRRKLRERRIKRWKPQHPEVFGEWHPTWDVDLGPRHCDWLRDVYWEQLAFKGEDPQDRWSHYDLWRKPYRLGD